MKKIAAATTNSAISKTIEKTCKQYTSFVCNIFGDADPMINFINYELPEIKVIDFTSTIIESAKIMEAIHNDSWLHYGGVIAICSDKAHIHELAEQKDPNILSILTEKEFNENFDRLLKILNQNQQFLYTRGLQAIRPGIESGGFVCGNDPIDIRFYTNFLVSYLFNTNRIDEEGRVNLQMTLMELLTNAVEHGNLGITYDEKSEWLMKGGDMMELIKNHAAQEQYKDREVKISYKIGAKKSVFTIADDGEGFDWKTAMAKKAEESETHGRGISLSRAFVKNMKYNEKGNEVMFTIDNMVNLSNSVPSIMANFDILDYQKNQIVCRQDEMTNDLFFMVSGRFAVYVNGQLVTVLTPNDLFIGEMAFLLNNRRTATVMAADNTCKLIKVPKTAFLSLIRKNPHYGIFLSKMLAQRLALQSQTTYAYQKQLEAFQE